MWNVSLKIPEIWEMKISLNIFLLKFMHVLINEVPENN